MIHITEVGPRDGLQNERKHLTTAEKVEMIQRLVDAGLRYIEAVSFVNPKVVPQMAGAEDVMAAVPRREGVTYAGLVLSRSGLERALGSGIDVIHIVLATSDTFNLRNARRTVEQGLGELAAVARDALAAETPVVGYLATAFGCPFEGEVPVHRVLSAAEVLLEAGCRGIVLCDTVGVAHPRQVQSIVETFRSRFGPDDQVPLGLHFHNTRGLGLANVYAGYLAGVRRFDASVGGLGGCPFAPKAVGNVCTEDMVNLFHQMGESTGVDLSRLVDAARWVETQVGRRLDSMMMKVGV